MNRKEAAELLPIIKAFAEGKVIQVKDNNVWKDVDNNHNCVFLPDSYEYRIKPETNYRPFMNAAECWQEMYKHQPFGWLKSKVDRHFVQLTVVADKGVMSLNGNQGWTLWDMMRCYTFADETPFGILEEE